jgi:integrase
MPERLLRGRQVACREGSAQVGPDPLAPVGIRASEIRSLRVEDLDMVERSIIVRREKGGKGHVVLALEEFMLTPIQKLGRTAEPRKFVLYDGR